MATRGSGAIRVGSGTLVEGVPAGSRSQRQFPTSNLPCRARLCPREDRWQTRSTRSVFRAKQNPIIREFAKERGWRNLRFLSSAGSTYNRDYQGENANGDEMPASNVFVRKKQQDLTLLNTELMFAPSDPGQDMRHVDMIWPLWNLFDVTPEGRGEKWNPKLAY